MMPLLAGIIGRLGLPGIAIILAVGFYEGVPVLNDIPFVERIPVVGYLIAGRVGRAHAMGEARERAIWEKLAWEQERDWERERRTAQAKIDQVASDSLEREMTLAVRMAALEQQLEMERTNETSGACTGTVFSDGLSRRLDAVGRD